MSVYNESISLKIKDVRFISIDPTPVDVAGRPYHALAFRMCGSASFTHNELKESTTEGDVFYMPADFSYSAEYKGTNDIIVIHFESELNTAMENFQLHNPHTIFSLFNKINKIWQEKKPGFYYQALALMCEILENISRQQSYSISNKTLTAFENTVAYIEENFTSAELSVNDIVNKSGMSNTYFRKLFCDRFNTTPIKYLMTKRLTYAESLLSTGKFSISEVAEMSGFYDVKYFSRAMKKEYGIPPSKLYRHIKT